MALTKIKNTSLDDADLVALGENGIGTSANQIVQLDSTGKLPAVDGSNLTGMASGNIGDLVSTNNLSDLTNTTTARSNLGLVIGTNVQAFDATIVVDADIGVNVQAYDADTTKNDVANTFSADQTFANAILNPTPVSDHLSSGIIAPMSCGETLVIGNLCYIKSDGKMWKTDADAVATMPGIAIALAGGAANASVSFLFYGFFRDDSYAWTVGADIYASGTAGALTATAPSGSGDIVQIVASATHADRIFFNPSLVTVELA
jgi:hypothetical protein